MTTEPVSVGDLLRGWRQRRRLSQLDLACEAEISQKHLSFVESGRSVPSREMVLRLADHLSIPLRDRNALLVTAGYAPVFPERAMDDPGLEAARRAVDLILVGHEPHPALAIDRHWTLVAANRAVGHLLAGIPDALRTPPVNVLRLSMHPDGLARRIRNFREWRAHVLGRLADQIDVSGDAGLTALLEELKGFPVPTSASHGRTNGRAGLGGVAILLDLELDGAVLSFISTTTVFGTALAVTLSELAIESFFPANRATAEHMARLHTRASGQ